MFFSFKLTTVFAGGESMISLVILAPVSWVMKLDNVFFLRIEGNDAMILVRENQEMIFPYASLASM
jgi:hypothetical protein